MALNSAQGKALWVVPVPEFGGVARHVLDAAHTGLPGYELVVLAPEGALTAELEKLGTRVIPQARFGTAFGFKTSFSTLDAVIEAEKPDVVHAHLAYADTVAAAVVTARKVRRLRQKNLWVPKLVTTEHGIADAGSVYNANALRAFAMKVLHGARLMVTDHKIAVSASTAEQMKKQWGARGVEVVHNGIDREALQKAVGEKRADSSSDTLRILSLSRLSPEKGLDILIDAFAGVLKKNPEAQLEIAGKGDLLAELEVQVKTLGISEAVTFSGFVNPAEAMKRNNMVAQLSVWENLSYTLLEAKSAGLRVIATDVGGNSEIVHEMELIPALTKLERPEAVAAVEAAIERVWTSDVAPGAAISTPEQMCQQIVAIYRKGR